MEHVRKVFYEATTDFDKLMYPSSNTRNAAIIQMKLSSSQKSSANEQKLF